ncbi:MAG: hypothetical protein WA477_16995, partial [Candidatus Sulfotelmatobacter sp.]
GLLQKVQQVLLNCAPKSSQTRTHRRALGNPEIVIRTGSTEVQNVCAHYQKVVFGGSILDFLHGTIRSGFVREKIPMGRQKKEPIGRNVELVAEEQ